MDHPPDYVELPIPVVETGTFIKNVISGNYSLSKIHLAVHNIFNAMQPQNKDIFFIAPPALAGTFKLIENCIITRPEYIDQVVNVYETSQHLLKAAAAQAFRKPWALGAAG